MKFASTNNSRQSLKALSLMGLVSLAACGKVTNPPSAQQPQPVSEIDSSSIIGGVAVETNDVVAASTVGIVDLIQGSVICTGSLIGANMVLTAAHCTVEDPRQLAILFSNKIPQTQEEASKMQVRQVVAGRTSALWPKLNPTKKQNWGDIAILRFAGAAPAGFKVATILAKSSDLKTGSTVTIAGFGLTDGVRHTDTTVLRKTEVTLADARFSQTEVTLDQRKGQGACHGDSGGPAFIKSGGALILFGVTSRGYQDPGDTCMGFSIYTNASAYLGWIKSTISALNKVTAAERIPQPAY